MKQAAEALGGPLPFQRTFSCDTLAAYGRQTGRFVAQPGNAQELARVTPGSFFLRRRVASDWEHTGIAVSVEGEVFHTIKGNTNDDGSREGFEVCARIRGMKNMDFVRL